MSDSSLWYDNKGIDYCIEVNAFTVVYECMNEAFGYTPFNKEGHLFPQCYKDSGCYMKYCTEYHYWYNVQNVVIMIVRYCAFVSEENILWGVIFERLTYKLCLVC